MQIIPAIDLRQGKCVRLTQGSFDQSTEYLVTPIAVAAEYAQSGATFIHIVDLDGAKDGDSLQWPLVKTLTQESKLLIQTGGGIRTSAHIERLLACGVSRVVVGSMAITQPHIFSEWLTHFGPDKIVFACDVTLNEVGNPRFAIQGWQQQSSINVWTLLDQLCAKGLQHVLCTDISRDGLLAGPNIDLYAQCQRRFPAIAWQASGGVSTLSQLIALKKLGLSAAIVGKALYEKHFTVSQAIEALNAC
jgi:phosphoribosylformimino-5-aminoimidazole carboxamide ribotide isomerase